MQLNIAVHNIRFYPIFNFIDKRDIIIRPFILLQIILIRKYYLYLLCIKY